MIEVYTRPFGILTPVASLFHAVERLGKVIPLTEGEMEALEMSMTEDEFETAVTEAQAGTFDPGPSSPLGSLGGPASESTSDLAQSLGSGEVVGSIRVQKFDGRNPTGSHTLLSSTGGDDTPEDRIPDPNCLPFPTIDHIKNRR